MLDVVRSAFTLVAEEVFEQVGPYTHAVGHDGIHAKTQVVALDAPQVAGRVSHVTRHTSGGFMQGSENRGVNNHVALTLLC